MHRACWALSIAVLSISAVAGEAQTCGGTERWPVKVGNDFGAGRVQLQSSQTTIAQMLSIPEPTLPGNNMTRLPQETTVYQLQGHLMLFKQESDNDYHLVIADDTLKYTNDPAQNGLGHSLIAEIPDPNCIAGAAGNPNPSIFLKEIQCARRKIDAKFPMADKTGQFNDTNAIPVTITGVAFFDPPHQQRGRATNNIELHPVLDIDFGDGQPSCLDGGQGVAGDFSVVANPAALIVAPGTSATVALRVIPVNGFAGNVAFSVSGQPAGVTPTLIVGMGSALSLQVSATAAASIGSSLLAVTASSGKLRHTLTIPLTVAGAATLGWEYKLITATTSEALLQQANTLGVQGWELVGVVIDTSRSDSYLGFMKRALHP